VAHEGSADLSQGPDAFGLPAGWLVIAPAAGQVLYRLVNRDPPIVRDFESDRTKDRPRFGEDLEVDHLGLSMFDTEDQALSMARRYPKLVAEVVLEPGLGFGLARTMLDLPGHYTVWGTPEDLLDQVGSLTRQDEE
jgi:hypothetical protein